MWANAASNARTKRPAGDRAAVILLYHRVTQLDTDPQLLAVGPDRFDQHLAYLREHATPLSLAELVERTAQDEIPQRAVVITFDDGYADNLDQAKPVLERYRVPATVFVTTSGIASEREFWWDDLGRLLLDSPSELAADAIMSIGGVDVRIPRGAYAPRQEYAGWTVLHADAPTPRHAAYRRLCEAIRPLDMESRTATIAAIEAKLGLGRTVRPTHRAMNVDQLRQLADGGLVEVGAHTLTHPVLSALQPEVQRREIVESKRILEDTLGLPVRAFSYPFGGRRDYTAETADLVRTAGFTSACANVPGLVTADADLLQLPRVLVRNWPVEEFAARFEAFWSCHESAVARSAS